MEQDLIKLDQFLKFVGAADSGAEAKMLITGGQVEVNGNIELRRGRKLHPGDRVQVEGQELVWDGQATFRRL